MDFDLPRDVKMLQDLVRRFVDQELIPIEMEINKTEYLTREALAPLQEKAKKLGLWLLDVPKEYGGQGLGLLAQCVVAEQVGRTKAMPFRTNELFGPLVSPLLLDNATEDQKARFLYPLLRNEIVIGFAQTEPDAGSDPAG